MKKELFQIIKIPEEVKIDLDENVLTVRGPEGEVVKKFNINKLEFRKKDDSLSIGSKKATKKEKKMMNTIASHIKNMIQGVKKKWEYRLKVCYSHFPINVSIQENNAEIKNFLGEKIPRKVKIPDNVEVKIDKDIIIINSVDKEVAGQAAANFETATKIKKKDRRVFQDGIFIINKAGREI